MNKPLHIDLNPSSAERWTTCTASPRFIAENRDKLPKEDRTFADEGTTAHEVAAALLQGRPINPKECPTPVTPEMHVHAFDYWDYVQGLLEDGKLMVEQKFPLWYMEGRFAKIDVAFLNTKHLHIVDLKYGEGITVSPVDNLQCAIYARCVMEDMEKQLSKANFAPTFFLPRHKISIHIFQPRARAGDTVKVWETTWGEIKQFTDERVSYAAKHVLPTYNGKLLGQLPSRSYTTVFAPSDKACQWCPAKGFCAARQAHLVKDLPLEVIDDSAKPLANTLTIAQRLAVEKHGDEIIKWIKDVQTYNLQEASAGRNLPGMKLALSRGGNRFWTDPRQAEKLLLKETILREDEIMTEPKLQGPAAIEKLLGKGKFPAKVFALIGKPPGQPIIVSEDDPRESYLIDGAKEFQVLD